MMDNNWETTVVEDIHNFSEEFINFFGEEIFSQMQQCSAAFRDYSTELEEYRHKDSGEQNYMVIESVFLADGE